MYFWNIKKLAVDLQEGRVSGREEMKYILLFFVFLVLGSHFAFFPPEPRETTALTMERIVILLLDLMITVGGVIAMFRANEKGDGRDLIKRGMCLGLPIAVRVMVFIVLIEGVFIVVTHATSPLLFTATVKKNSFYTFWLIGEVVSWIWLTRVLKNVATGSATEK